MTSGLFVRLNILINSIEILGKPSRMYSYNLFLESSSYILLNTEWITFIFWLHACAERFTHLFSFLFLLLTKT